MNLIREYCAGSVSQAIKADKTLVDRIELCTQLDVGGVTPSLQEIQWAAQHISTDIALLVRPRAGDFVYSDVEIKQMLQAIDWAKTYQLESVVFGVLRPSHTIDLEQNERLIAYAAPLRTVFHMAFDDVDQYQVAYEIISALGFDRVLTKGSKTRAQDGVERLKWMVSAAKQRDSATEILVGGGVTAQNYRALHAQTGATQFHGTKIISIE